VQIDDTFFGRESHGEGKRGRGSDQEPVVVAIEVERHKPKHILLALGARSLKVCRFGGTGWAATTAFVRMQHDLCRLCQEVGTDISPHHEIRNFRSTRDIWVDWTSSAWRRRSFRAPIIVAWSTCRVISRNLCIDLIGGISDIDWWNDCYSPMRS